MSQILSEVLHEQSERSDDRDGSIESWWQVEQLAAAKAVPAVECVGLFVVCQVVRWQPEFPQSVGAIESA